MRDVYLCFDPTLSDDAPAPRELLQRVAKEGPEAAGLVDADGFVRASAASGMVRLRGAVFLQVVGTMEPQDLR